VTAYLDQNNLDAAKSLIGSLRQQDPDNLSIQLKTGQVLEKESQWSEALQLYQQAGQKQPQSLEIKAAIARVLLSQEDYGAAAIAFQALVNREPNNADFYYGLGLALQKEERTEEAQPYLQKAQQLYRQHNNVEGLKKVELLLNH